jgi:hypothetical protein
VGAGATGRDVAAEVLKEGRLPCKQETVGSIPICGSMTSGALNVPRVAMVLPKQVQLLPPPSLVGGVGRPGVDPRVR